MFEDLKNYREVGDFDLLSPPLSPLGTLDANTLAQDLESHWNKGCRNLGIELTGIPSLYSDALNVIAQFLKHPERQRAGALGILGASGETLKQLEALKIHKGLCLFPHEGAMMSWSVQHHDEILVTPPPMTSRHVAVQIPSTPPPVTPLTPTPSPSTPISEPQSRKTKLIVWVAAALALVGLLLLGLLNGI